MGFAHRLLYPTLNAAWGASLGTCAALLAYQVGSWSDHHPSSGLLLAGSLAIFGAAYVATVIGRGQRPTLRGERAPQAAREQRAEAGECPHREGFARAGRAGGTGSVDRPDDAARSGLLPFAPER